MMLASSWVTVYGGSVRPDCRRSKASVYRRQSFPGPPSVDLKLSSESSLSSNKKWGGEKDYVKQSYIQKSMASLGTLSLRSLARCSEEDSLENFQRDGKSHDFTNKPCSKRYSRFVLGFFGLKPFISIKRLRKIPSDKFR